MIKYRIQARNVANVAASKTVLIDLPVGKRYHRLILEHGYSSGTNTAAAAATNITEVRVKANGRIQRRFSGTQLRDLNLLNGTQYDFQGVPNTAPGVAIPIFFAEPWRIDARDRDALAWPTFGWDTFQVEVDLGAASTPTLVCSAIVDNFQPQSASLLVKQFPQSFSAGGTSVDIATIDRRDFLQQISFYPDSGGSNAATRVTMRLNGEILHELTASANKSLLVNSEITPAASGRTSNVYDMVLDHDDLLGSAVSLNGARDLTFTVEAGSAMSGTITAMVQRLGPLE